MKSIEIYTSSICAFCIRAKALLDANGLNYTEVDVYRHPEMALDMQRRSGSQTLPQIFIDGDPIGGYTELRQLQQMGSL